jgi:hypothetical protein
MPTRQDQRFRLSGTRFRLFAQPRFLEGYEEPETVWVSTPRGSVGPGPSDQRMIVVDAVNKQPYAPDAVPIWRGERRPPVPPGPDGHFDHLDPASREFGAAHMFGVVRRVLDIWEGYLGRPITWHFADLQPRLELIPYVEWDNAQAGFGYMECGFAKPRAAAPDGPREPFCLNFDALAHETGHLLVFALLGIPDDATLTTEYRAFHESASDLVALLSALHFDSVIDRVLNACKGNLYLENELNRMAELSRNEQIRLASNGHRMRDVPDPETPWDRLTQRQLHQVGEPMTGAVFDILVEIFQEILVARGLIPRSLDDLADRAANGTVDADSARAGFEAAYAADPGGFRRALVCARDLVGMRLARTLQQVPPHNLHLADAAARFLATDRRRSGARFQRIIIDSFRWREIGYGYRRTAA